jgi:hypothetical protein
MQRLVWTADAAKESSTPLGGLRRGKGLDQPQGATSRAVCCCLPQRFRTPRGGPADPVLLSSAWEGAAVSAKLQAFHVVRACALQMCCSWVIICNYPPRQHLDTPQLNHQRVSMCVTTTAWITTPSWQQCSSACLQTARVAATQGYHQARK